MIAAIAVVVLFSTIGTLNMLSTPQPTGGPADQLVQQSPKHFHSNQLHHTSARGRGDADSGEDGDGEDTKENGDQYHHSGVAVVKSVEGADDVEQETGRAGKEAGKKSSAAAADKIVQNKDAEDIDDVRAHIMRNIFQSSNSQGALSVDIQQQQSNINKQNVDAVSVNRQLFNSNGKNIFNTEQHFLINHRNTCQVERNSNGQDQVKVILFLIPSEPKNSLRRKIIRQTWLNTTNVTTNVVFRNLFVLGKSSYSVSKPEKWKSTLELLKWENRLYNDILLGDFVESYWNLTYKTMFGITWANFFCQGADFIFKIDDDVLVLQNKFLPLLHTFPREDFFGGFCTRNGKPHRDQKNKWYISEQEFPKYSKSFQFTAVSKFLSHFT